MRSHRVAFWLTLGLASCLWGADPFVGTWKLNVEKTKVITGLPPKEGNLTKSLEGDYYVGTESDTFGNGIHVATRFTEPVSGGPIKYQEGRAPTDGLDIVKRINTNTREIRRTRGGKLTLRERSVISKDGKTMIAHAKGTNAQGKPFDRIEIWERQ